MKGTPFRELLVDERQVLAINTGHSAKSFAQTGLAELLSEPGYLISPTGNLSEWRTEGITEQDGRIHVYGPLFRGERLTVLLQHEQTALNVLRRYIQGRLTLAKNGRSDAGPIPGACLFSDDGTMFIAPFAIIARSLDGFGESVSLDFRDQWVHPDLEGQDAEVYCAAALAYRVLCGAQPFNGLTLDHIRERMRSGTLLPARLACVRLKEEISSLIDRALQPQDSSGLKSQNPKRPELAQLAQALGNPGTPIESLCRDLPAEELQRREKEAVKTLKAQEQRIKFHRFFKYHGTSVAIGAAILVFLGLLANSILTNAANKPTTAGMDSEQVVFSYYNAFNNLDYDLMEAAARSSAVKRDLEGVLNLTVIIRMREGYENIRAFYPYEQWVIDGKPDTVRLVFGISGLKIKAQETSNATAIYRADYIMQEPATRAAGTDADNRVELPIAQPVPMPRSDILTLELKKGLWRISSISRTEPSIEELYKGMEIEN